MNANLEKATANLVPLPLGVGMPQECAPSAPQRSELLQILLVEDDEADAYLIRRALAKNPRVREVLLVEDGVEALDLLEQHPFAPDLAIVDLCMPRKDGIALLKDLSKRASLCFPSIVLSSSKSSKDALRAKKIGALEFVSKPKSEEKLKAVLDRAIRNIC